MGAVPETGSQWKDMSSYIDVLSCAVYSHRAYSHQESLIHLSTIARTAIKLDVVLFLR